MQIDGGNPRLKAQYQYSCHFGDSKKIENFVETFAAAILAAETLKSPIVAWNVDNYFTGSHTQNLFLSQFAIVCDA